MRKITVNLVEDNPDVIQLLTDQVDWDKMGCELTGTASDGVTGMKMLLKQQPDIVLTNIKMPGMNGLEML